MENKLIKDFVKKSIVKTIIFAVIMCIIASIAQSLSPVVSNALALTQMQNSDEMYMLMNTYNNIRPIINALYICVIAFFVYTLSRDTYKFVKTINTENEKEKEN